MQSVSSAFTAEAQDNTRRIAHNLQVSWKAESTLGNRTFTIGVSTIGGDDFIGVNAGAIGSPSNYSYLDESDYVLALSWERQLNIPTGGITKAFADGQLDNTSGRFLPSYMGGNSELFTAIRPKSPNIINAGFVINGVEEEIPQFSGLFSRMPRVDAQNKTLSFESDDYIGYFENRKVDDTAMFTGVTTDQIIETLLIDAGMSTAQYELDQGLNDIPFTIIESGADFYSVINELAMAENGHFLQDEEGKFYFWNRQHFLSAPYTDVQAVIHTSQVINSETPSEDHIINVVEINSNIWEKRASQQIFELSGSIEIIAGQETEVFVNLDDPVLEVTSQTITGNTQPDGSGSAISINIESRTVFSQAIKYVLTSTSSGYITVLTVNGRSAIVGEELYTRIEDGSSLTAYQEKTLTINNKYIQSRTWANSFSQVILNRFSDAESLLKITIRALPQLQYGDLISWQGISWRVYGIRSSLDANSGFIQELLLVKARLESYFTIGVSEIGGADKIAA